MAVPSPLHEVQNVESAMNHHVTRELVQNFHGESATMPRSNALSVSLALVFS